MTNNWNVEYERRLRRIVGVTDDSLSVSVDSEIWRGSDGCDTCGHNSTPDHLEITVLVTDPTDDYTYHSKEFTDLGELMRALIEVEDV